MSEVSPKINKPIPAQLQKIARFVKLMDSQFKIPGTKITFGLDPIIGMVPYLGDLVDYGISAYILVSMVKSGASSRVVAKMIGNITIDGLIGLIPFLGKIFDVFYKANRRNLTLAVEHFEENKHQGSAWPIVLPILLILFLLFIAIGVLGYFTLKFLYLFLFTNTTF